MSLFLLNLKAECHQVCRQLLVIECACLVCEFGVVMCTLLYLFSVQQSGRSKGSSSDAAETQNQIVLSFLSLATNIFTFAIRLAGVSNTLAAAHRMLGRISNAALPAFSTRSLRLTAPGSLTPLPEDLNGAPLSPKSHGSPNICTDDQA